MRSIAAAGAILAVAGLLSGGCPSESGKGASPQAPAGGAKKGRTDAGQSEAPAEKGEPAGKAEALSEDDEIRALVVLRLIEDAQPEIARLELAPKAYYVSLDGERDPSEVFLAKLGKVNLPVRKGSLCHVPAGVQDKKTGEEGLLISLDKFERKDKDSAVLEGVFIYGNLGGMGGDYVVRREGKGWDVKKGNKTIQH
jgi:hypothetical protein